MKCPRCGKRAPSTERVCKHCGKRLPRAKKAEKPKGSLSTHVPTNKWLIAGIGGVLIFIALVLAILLPGGNKREAEAKFGQADEEINIAREKIRREIACDAVYGEVVATNIEATRHGTITVQSLHTGKVYTFYVGWHTSYHPQRYPFIGERVKIYHLNDEASMKATQITLEQ
jgi:hypothetical protein